MNSILLFNYFHNGNSITTEGYAIILCKSPVQYFSLFRKQFEKAVQDFTDVIELDPTSSASYNHRGFAFKQLGKFQLALKGN